MLRLHNKNWTIIALVLVAFLNGCGGTAKTRETLAAGSAQQIYEAAKRSMELSGYDRAIYLYELLEVRHPFSEYTKLGQLDLMYAYYKNRAPESAVDAASKFIRENPRHPQVDYAYYVRGLAYFPDSLNPIEKLFRVDPTLRPQGAARTSFDNFALFVEKFPESEWAADARQRMIYLRNSMASYELNVAQYYVTRKAWIAAANRAKIIVEQYQESPAVLDALRIMVRSYNELGLTDLAADAERVLQQNLRLSEAGS